MEQNTTGPDRMSTLLDDPQVNPVPHDWASIGKPPRRASSDVRLPQCMRTSNEGVPRISLMMALGNDGNIQRCDGIARRRYSDAMRNGSKLRPQGWRRDAESSAMRDTRRSPSRRSEEGRRGGGDHHSG
ncbi:hypothetical protein NL676_039238 [Syzygium grande]|nr:hypothetical protein NL676_039238 [Syzygium grande]